MNMLCPEYKSSVISHLKWLMEFEAKREDKKRSNLSLVCEGLVIRKRNSREMWGTADGKAVCIYFDDEIVNCIKNSLESPDEWEIMHIGVMTDSTIDK